MPIKDADKLKKIRDRFSYILAAWKSIREEGATDMRFLAGDSWDPAEKRERMNNHRPCISLDELTQYPNQIINDVRQNKRGVKVNPEGGGANDKSSQLLEDWIRGIEYQSNAQAAYITGFENQLNRSYGFWKLETFYPSDESFDLSVKIVRIANPDTILYDPDCKEYDCSDAEDCFEIDFISQEKFNRDYPDAEIKEFTEEIRKEAPDWVKEKQVQVASYWQVKKEAYELLEVDAGEHGTHIFREDELPENFDEKKTPILKRRQCLERRIIQTVLNGVEILEVNDPEDEENPKGWPGKWIPIIPCFGKELFIEEGSGSKRILMSLVRLARDPQRMFNYFATLEAEEAALTPKTPYIGWKGQFDGNEGWDTIHQIPRAYVEVNAIVESGQLLDKPSRTPFVPNFQQYEMAKESAKRSIQSAMGISPLPTAAMRNNEKSGIALEKIASERSQGSYHFIDNFNRSIEFTGRQLTDLWEEIQDTPRDVSIRKSNEEHSIVRVNDPHDPKNREAKGEHSVTITTGPSYQSQREEAAAFADLIAKMPGVFPIIGDLLVKLRNLGPIGDEIAERLTPPQFAQKDGQEPLPPHALQAIQQKDQQVQALNALCQKLEGEIKQLHMEQSAKMVEMASRERMIALQEQTKLVVAQASLQRENAESILQAELVRIGNMIDQLHEHSMADHQAQIDKDQASHESDLVPPAAAQPEAGAAQ